MNSIHYTKIPAYKNWLVYYIGLDHAEANDLCVSGYATDRKRDRRYQRQYLAWLNDVCEGQHD